MNSAEDAYEYLISKMGEGWYYPDKELNEKKMKSSTARSGNRSGISMAEHSETVKCCTAGPLCVDIGSRGGLATTEATWAGKVGEAVWTRSPADAPRVDTGVSANAGVRGWT